MSFVWPLENLPVHAAKQFHGRRPDILLRPPSSKPSQPACCADRKKVRLVPAFGELQFPVLQLDASQLLQCLTCLRRCGSSKDALKVSLLEKGPLVLWKGHPDELLFRILTFPSPQEWLACPRRFGSSTSSLGAPGGGSSALETELLPCNRRPHLLTPKGAPGGGNGGNLKHPVQSWIYATHLLNLENFDAKRRS